MIAAALFQVVTVLSHGTVVDGTGAPPRRDAVVVIEDSRIALVADAGDYEAPSGAELLDVSGKWIVPGLIETHTHLFDSGSLYTSPDDFDLTARVPHAEERERIRASMSRTLERYVCAGVTTVASLGGPRWELDVARTANAPRVMTSGPFLANFPVGDVTLWTEDDPVLVELESSESARRRVRQLSRRGVALIKVGFGAGSGLTLDAFRPKLDALVDEAHRLGLRVAMHAEELDAAKMAVRAGVDALAHTIVDRAVDDEFLDLASSKGTIGITGLAHFDRYRAVLDGAVELLPIERRCGDPAVIATWAELARIDDRPEMPASVRWGSSDEARNILRTNVLAMMERGVPVAAGSNGGTIGMLQGPSYHLELHAMAAAGMPRMDVLTAATLHAARALGVDDDRGSVTAGKLADLLVLRADPLESVEHFGAIDAVLIGGVWMDQGLARQ